MTLFERIYHHPHISKTDINEIIASHTRTEVSKNEIILTEGKISNEYFVVEQGFFRSFINHSNGNEITTDFFAPNDLLIEVPSIFLRIPAKENIQASTDAVIWKLEFQKFQELFHKMEGFREWGRWWMSNQLVQSKQRAINGITKSAKERYLALMREHPYIFAHVSLKQIASYLGVTDSSLSRIRKEIILDW